MNTPQRFLLTLPLVALCPTASAQLADLTVREFAPSSTQLIAGRVISTRITVRNAGLTKANANRGLFYIEYDRFRRQEFFSVAIPEIRATKEWTTTVRVPVPVNLETEGNVRFFFKADADDIIRELSEINNLANHRATATKRPDLVISNLQSSTQQWLRGQDFTLSLRVKNQGSLPTSRCRIGAYISADPSITPADRQLTSRVLLPLQPGAESSFLFTVRVPATWPTGACAIGCYLDTLHEVTEALENNNSAGIHGRVILNGTYRSIGTGCRGSFGVPIQTGSGTPRAGTTVTYRVGNAMPRGVVMTILGLDSRTWGNVPLPLDLAPLGARGCSLLVSFDVLMLGSASSTGVGTRQLQLPAITAGHRFYTQFAVASRANRLGLAISNAIETTVGTR